jgi:succinoglycan biosynthesis protein ExoA
LSRPQPLHFPGNNAFQRMVASVRESKLGHGIDSTIYSIDNARLVDPTSSGAIYKKSVFDRIGYYDESFDACEDVEFNHRVKAAGMKAYIDPSLTVFYQPRASFASIFKQLQRYGKGRFRLIRKHASAFSIAQIVPPGLVIYLAGFAASFAFLPEPWQWAAAMPLVLYLALVLGFSLSLVPRHGPKMLVYGPALYFTVHGALGWGFLTGLAEFLSGRAPRPADHNAAHRKGA